MSKNSPMMMRIVRGVDGYSAVIVSTDSILNEKLCKIMNSGFEDDPFDVALLEETEIPEYLLLKPDTYRVYLF
jgi:hypothetical protein